MNAKNRVAVLLSGNGSNLQAMLDQQPDYSYDIVCVISNRPDAFGLERAKAANIPAIALDHKAAPSRQVFEDTLIAHIERFAPDWIILAGYMRILSADFVARFARRLINIHPSLLPDYKGLRTHQRVLGDGQKKHGASVHFVTAELDSGAIIVQASLMIEVNDTETSLCQRVQAMEHKIYPMAVDFLTSGRLTFLGDQLWLDSDPLDQKGYQVNEQQLLASP
ncbi:phosphoribosylglycinamide formyltransferase [Candidatus Sororendozoicomonas aggregata]|uniref:phosphoribosylglycinamide formyltransferase n=1 Tax=Candidatus Sororendozoicomonas aggregata TaxID=3073239 RepID=UPI002ED643DA